VANIELNINGSSYSLPEVPGETLASLLRDRLRLTGTKIGCGEGRCGICTVLVDDKPVKSCLYPARKAAGKSILTIEGLRALSPTPGSPHPLQAAFASYGAIQCGFCTPSQILNAYAYLLKHPDPDYAELKSALKDVLCRCGAYEAILQAVLAAAAVMRGGGSLPAPNISMVPAENSAIGTLHPRPDAAAKADGSAIFTDDLTSQGCSLRVFCVRTFPMRSCAHWISAPPWRMRACRLSSPPKTCPRRGSMDCSPAIGQFWWVWGSASAR
jgi:aerobic-type carbon monoxide dehydrogenase small subunit (CoxS/CutS family)